MYKGAMQPMILYPCLERMDPKPSPSSASPSRSPSVLEPLVETGVIVVAYDCRGHGRSAPSSKRLRSWIGDFNWLVHDLIEFTALTRCQCL